MKKTFYLLLLFPLVLSACSNSNDENKQLAENSTNTSTQDTNTITTDTGSNEIGGSFGAEFNTSGVGNGEDSYDIELLKLGFKGPEFYTELSEEASNSFVYTGLNFSTLNDSIEKFIIFEDKPTYTGRFAPIIASYLESHYSYTDTDNLYPSYAINLNTPFYTSKESIEYFEKRFDLFQKGNKFNNEVILEIKKFTTNDKVGLDSYLKNIFSDLTETSPVILLSNLFFKNQGFDVEINNKNIEKILTTFLIQNENNKVQYLCALQTPDLIPLSNLPDSASESYVKLFNSKKDDPLFSFLLPDYAHLDSLIRAYIYPGLSCFDNTGK